MRIVSKLRGMTKGRASYSMKLKNYQAVPTHIQQEVSKERAEAKAES